MSRAAKRDAPRRPLRRSELLLFLLLLLTDADLGMQVLGIGERFVIVARDGIRQVLIHTRALRQDCHQGVAIIADRAEGPETLYIRNCHNFYSLTRRPGAALIEGAER